MTYEGCVYPIDEGFDCLTDEGLARIDLIGFEKKTTITVQWEWQHCNGRIGKPNNLIEDGLQFAID